MNITTDSSAKACVSCTGADNYWKFKWGQSCCFEADVQTVEHMIKWLSHDLFSGGSKPVTRVLTAQDFISLLMWIWLFPLGLNLDAMVCVG